MDSKMMNDLEQKFMDYTKYDKFIINHKVHLILKAREEQQTDEASIDFSNDHYIKECLLLKRAIEKVLEELSQEDMKLIVERYWGIGSWMTWQEYARKVHYSTSSMSRLKQKVLLAFSQEINLMRNTKG